MKRILAALALVFLLGLAYVHWILPGKVEASMNVVLPHKTYVISDCARRLHDSLFVADLPKRTPEPQPAAGGSREA